MPVPAGCCQTGTGDQKGKNTSNTYKPMGGADAEVSLAQHQKSQQKNHSGYAVVRTKEHAKKCHKHKAEGHHKIDFKIIDKNVASFLFWIGCVFDQGFGAGRT